MPDTELVKMAIQLSLCQPRASLIMAIVETQCSYNVDEVDLHSYISFMHYKSQLQYSSLWVMFSLSRICLGVVIYELLWTPNILENFFHDRNPIPQWQVWDMEFLCMSTWSKSDQTAFFWAYNMTTKNGGNRLSRIILGMVSANERRRYYVTPPLIGWAHTQNDPWLWTHKRHSKPWVFLLLRLMLL